MRSTSARSLVLALVLALLSLAAPAATAGAQWISYPTECSAYRLSLASVADSTKLRCRVDRARVDRMNQAITSARADSVALVARIRLAAAYKAETVAVIAYQTYMASLVKPAPTPILVPHGIAITPSGGSLTVGGSLTFSARVYDSAGTTIAGLPIVWGASPSSVATITSGGGVLTASGAGTATVSASTPTAPGATRTVSVAVTAPPITTPPVVVTPPDTTIATTPPPIGATIGPATVAERPRVTYAPAPPACTTTVRVLAGADLQAAINLATPGTCLLLTPGATYAGNFTLPNTGTSSTWVTIRTDVADAVLGAPGSRMTPSRATALGLAKLVTTNNVAPVVTLPGAHHWRLTGVEITGGTAAGVEIGALVRFGTWETNEPTVASMAHDLVIDRSYVHGTPKQLLRRCVLLSSAATLVVDSWVAECHSTYGDSQTILALGGAGPYTIDNNTLSGGHEVIMFGGGDPVVTNLVASDVTITRNHITRPVTDRGVWPDKNLLELKSARRVLISGNIIENNWADAQNGFAVLVKSVNQDGGCPLCGTEDVTVDANIVRKSGAGINIAGDVQGPSLLTSRITFTDNVIDSLNVGPYSAGVPSNGIQLQLLAKASNVAFLHNSFLNAPGGNTISISGTDAVQSAPLGPLAIIGSLFFNSGYGVKGDGVGEGSAAFATFAPSLAWRDVLDVGADCSRYPAGTLCPASLPSTMPLAADGKPIGADRARVAAATRGVVVAP